MKLLISICLMLPLVVNAARIRAMWDPSPAYEGVTNYIIYCGTNSGQYMTNWNVGTRTNYTFGVLETNGVDKVIPISRYMRLFFAARAQNEYGVSDLSEEAVAVLLPSDPKGLYILQIASTGEMEIGFREVPDNFTIERSHNLTNWTPWFSMWLYDRPEYDKSTVYFKRETKTPAEFFRLVGFND